MTDGEVWFEFSTNDSKAAKVRLMDATIECKATLRPYAMFGITGLVKVAPVNAELFRETAQLHLFIYRSPTYFDNGSLRSQYDSPEDELAGKHSAPYVAWLRRQETGT